MNVTAVLLQVPGFYIMSGTNLPVLPTGRWLQRSEAAAERGQGIQTQHKEATGLIQRPDSFRPCSLGPPAPRFSSATQHRQGLQPRPMASTP